MVLEYCVQDACAQAVAETRQRSESFRRSAVKRYIYFCCIL